MILFNPGMQLARLSTAFKHQGIFLFSIQGTHKDYTQKLHEGLVDSQEIVKQGDYFEKN